MWLVIVEELYHQDILSIVNRVLEKLLTGYLKFNTNQANSNNSLLPLGFEFSAGGLLYKLYI